MTKTEIIRDIRPADGWTVRQVWADDDGSHTFETMTVVGWAVVAEHEVGRWGEVLAPTGETSIQPAVWEPTEGQVVLYDVLELSNAVVDVVPPGCVANDAALVARLRTKMATGPTHRSRA